MSHICPRVLTPVSLRHTYTASSKSHTPVPNTAHLSPWMLHTCIPESRTAVPHSMHMGRWVLQYCRLDICLTASPLIRECIHLLQEALSQSPPTQVLPQFCELLLAYPFSMKKMRPMEIKSPVQGHLGGGGKARPRPDLGSRPHTLPA